MLLMNPLVVDVDRDGFNPQTLASCPSYIPVPVWSLPAQVLHMNPIRDVSSVNPDADGFHAKALPCGACEISVRYRVQPADVLHVDLIGDMSARSLNPHRFLPT